MEHYPQDFSFERSSDRLHEYISTSDHLKQAREQIIKLHQAALERHEEFYLLNLKDYKPILRKAIIMDLAPKFPHIAYKMIFTNQKKYNELFSCVFPKSINQQVNMIWQQSPFIRIKEAQFGTYDYSAEVYMVALTSNFAQNMESHKM